MPGLHQRFVRLQFGKTYTDEELYVQFKHYLQEIEDEGASVLNQMEYLHSFIDSGVRSQRSNLNWIYIMIHVQAALWLLLFIRNNADLVYHIMALLVVFVQYGICWLAVFSDRQGKFMMVIQQWLNQLDQEIIVLNHVTPDIGRLEEIDEWFDEREFARLWLRELSPSMNMTWKKILIELLPSGNPMLPAIRVTLGGKRKAPQHAVVYGFADKNKRDQPNQLLKTLKMFASVNPMPFYGENDDREIFEKQIERLRSHLINLFGKRVHQPITAYIDGLGWRSRLRIKDRTDSTRELMQRSANTFGKILISYTGLSISRSISILSTGNDEEE